MDIIYYCSGPGGGKAITSQSKESGNSDYSGFRSKVASLLNYIEKNNEFKFTIGKDLKSGLCYICERYKGSLLSALKDEKVSVYELKLYQSDRSESYWADKLEIRESYEIISEEKIENIYEYLIELSKQGVLIISKYPKRINGIPVDDQDLVDRAILQYRMYGESIIATIEQYHPQLLNRVKQGIDSDAFIEYGI